MASTHMKTTGMSCDVCSALVEMSLERLPGVIAATSNLDTGLTTVLYDPREVDELEIADAIRGCGFRTRLIDYPQFVDHGDIRSGTRGAATPPDPGAERPAGDDGTSTAVQAKRVDLHAVHVRTSGLRCRECIELIEATLAHLDGVVDVTAVKSLGLTSVLFDKDRIDRETIAGAIRRAGFGADVIR